MKKITSTIFIVAVVTVVFIFCFRSCAFASGLESELVALEEAEEISETLPTENVQDDTKEFDLKLYIQERIVPIISGVGTAVFTIILSLGPIFKAAKSIKNAVAAFSKKDEERNASQKESNRIMQKNIDKIEACVANVPKLQEQTKMLEKQVDELKRVCFSLAEITALGFQSNAEVVRSGKGKKMALLLDKAASLTGVDSIKMAEEEKNEKTET